MDINIVKECWLVVFPSGHITSRVIMGNPSFTMYLQKPDQWLYGISHNDPLSYSAFINGDTWEENQHSLTVKATDQHRAYGSVKIRKQNIKAVDKDKLLKRFQKIRQIAEENKDNIVHTVTL